MLTPRAAIVSVVAFAVLVLVVGVGSLLVPPGGKGGDSHGTQSLGYRGLFDILKALNVPVERSVRPPTDVLDRNTTLLFLEPHAGLVKAEPAYLHRVAEWVKAGGRVVVTPGRDAGPIGPGLALSMDDDLDTAAIFEELGLPDFDTFEIDLGMLEAGTLDPSGAEPIPADAEIDDWQAEDNVGSLFFDTDGHEFGILPPEQTVAIAIEASGELAGLQDAITTIEVSESELRVIDPLDSKPDGIVNILTDSDEDYAIAALYHLGKGEIIVISDPSLARNDRIANQDNSVLLANLLVSGDRPIVFDEFYHGLTIRGNPLWLMTRASYAILTLAVLGLVGLWIWRQSVFLGPPLKPAPENRRSIGEYVEAMARFFLRGKNSRPFLLGEMRDGMLWALRHRLGLPPGRETPEDLAAALSRRDPRAARELVEATTLVNETLALRRNASDKQSLEALKRMSACL